MIISNTTDRVKKNEFVVDTNQLYRALQRQCKQIEKEHQLSNLSLAFYPNKKQMRLSHRLIYYKLFLPFKYNLSLLDLNFTQVVESKWLFSLWLSNGRNFRPMKHQMILYSNDFNFLNFRHEVASLTNSVISSK